MDGNNLIEALNNINQIVVPHAGATVYIARLDAFDRDKNMLFSGSGTGAGLSYSFGAILPYNGEGFDRVPLTLNDSLEIAQKDTIIFMLRGGKEYLKKKKK